MATIDASDKGGFDIRLLAFGDFIDNVAVAKPDMFRINYDDGSYAEFRGRGFLYGKDGLPTAGSVDSYLVSTEDGAKFRMDDISIEAVDIIHWAENYSDIDDIILLSEEFTGAAKFIGGSRGDIFRAQTGADELGGAGGRDVLSGDDGADTIRGGSGYDRLFGESGDDRISGGKGRDTLYGGEGADTFRFDVAPGQRHADEIDDFDARFDTIGLDLEVFVELGGADRLKASAYREGEAAEDRSDRIIYDGTTGRLLYDPDGSGRQEAQLFARLDPGTDLSAQDFSLL